MGPAPRIPPLRLLGGLSWKSPKFDLRQSYFLIAGIAGINPKHGTIGTAAWAHYLVEFGTQWELDSRDAPKDWPTGYLGINTKGPNEKPPLDYKTEVFELNPKLQAKAYAEADFSSENQRFVELFREYFPVDPPARSTVGVAALPAGGAVEIEAWAYKPL